ncbi:MAG: response regulator, partial [Symploca sp. SIO2G7]|nr:response regulator [Symploca sp. SIO2G7]
GGQDDDSRFPIPDSRFPIPDSQFPIPDSQFPIPNSQFPIPDSQFPIPNSQFPIPKQNLFDSLELDEYSEAQLLIQSVLEDAVQLAEANDAIELFARQSHQTLETQRRLLTSTRDVVMETRMVPLGEIFAPLPRVLRQLEALHHKSVGLEIRGTEVMVDKVVAQKLYDPLLHLVRNAFDHGVESPEIRREQGKLEKGEINICAYYRGRYLVIEVGDDGQGLNFEKIRQRAIACQLVSAQQARALKEEQLKELLFEPGFSTNSEVNELSGRGIGLDVVRAQLQALQGSVEVNSEFHQGTSFILRIPQNLTISKLLLCQAGNRTYALLAEAIEQILIPRPEQLRCWEDGKVLRWEQGSSEQLIPIHRLEKILDYSLSFLEKPNQASQQQVMPLMLIRCQDELLGLEVDQLFGDQELVIRPLERVILPPNYIYGSSILADGQLALVIDGAALMHETSQHQFSSTQSTVERNQPSLPAARSITRAEVPTLPYVDDVVNLAPRALEPSQEQQQFTPQTHTALPRASVTQFRGKSSKMILLVDDSITLRQTLAMTLEKANYRVVQAKDGYEALEKLQQQMDIQLVICDIEMPRMNGFEFLKYRQQDPTLVDIPVVILTSRSGEKHRLIATELGATTYLTKPYLEQELLNKVKNLFGQ